MASKNMNIESLDTVKDLDTSSTSEQLSDACKEPQNAGATSSAVRCAFLMNFLAPDVRPIAECLANRLANLRVLVSVPMEGNRNWEQEETTFDVVVQKTKTITREDKHPDGYTDVNYVHLPKDTLGQLRSYCPDVIVSTELGMRTIHSVCYRMLHRRCRLIIAVSTSEHIEASRNSFLRRLYRRCILRFADRVTYHGPSCRRFLEQLGADEKQLRPFFYAADPEKCYLGEKHYQTDPSQRNASHGTDESGKPFDVDLITVGQLIERKGIRFAIRDLASWCEANPRRNLRWTLAGSGELEHEIREFVAPKNFCIRLLGNCTRKQLWDLYRSSTLMLFPTLGDEWGLVVDEAMHSGIVVIGSIFAQSTEVLVQDESTGWRYDPNDTESLHQSLSAWATLDLQGRAEMGRTAREAVASRTPDAAASQLIRIIQEFRVN